MYLRLATIVVLLIVNGATFAQQMHVKSHNFFTFSNTPRQVGAVLERKSSTIAKQHPEYGVLPYNARCVNCVELVEKRTIDSRFYLDMQKPGVVYIQKSYFPLHYKKSKDDVWRTVDPRLKPDVNMPGIYSAANQPFPAGYNANTHQSFITVADFVFNYNGQLNLYFFDEDNAYTAPQTPAYENYTIGDEGVEVNNIWPGINQQIVYRPGEIKTNYVINKPLQLPINKGWMVIEDNFDLPAGYTLQASGGHTVEGKYYQGNYLIKNTVGDTLLLYGEPVYYDALAYGVHGAYQLLQSGNKFTLRMLIPVSWLNRPENVYPLTIDPPLFTGVTKAGDFVAYNSSGSANLAFTSLALGSCDYHMNVVIPGKTQLLDTYIDLEYQLTYDDSCGSPPIPAPYCTFSQVAMEVQCDSCHTSTGRLFCNPANPPYTGTCTTDSNSAPGAGPYLVENFNPGFLSCYTPQCQDYNIGFTLKNTDSICGDVCGYLCARGNMWQVLVTGAYLDGYITADKTSLQAGDSVTYTVYPSYGVPPYRYVWIVNGLVADTITGTNTYTVIPHQDAVVDCEILDNCGGIYITNDIAIHVTGIFPTGVEEVSQTLIDFKILPNPNNGSFTMQATLPSALKSTLKIYDTNGKMVYNQVVTFNKGENNIPINVADLPKGVYQLVVEAPGANNGIAATNSFIIK